LRDKEGKRLDSATSQLLFVKNGVICAIYDNKPEVHEEYAGDNLKKYQLCLWQLTTKNLTDSGLLEGEFECRLSGVGGRDGYVGDVVADDRFSNDAGVLPVVHGVGARKVPSKKKICARAK